MTFCHSVANMLDKPYRRIIRPFTLSEDGYSVGVLDDSYLMDSDYVPDRVTLIRAYNTIERDLVRLFEYVEPADANLATYSHRVYELLLRACTEFEANCKGILNANAYAKSGNWNIADYYRINSSSRLSVIDACPNWQWRTVAALARFGGLRCSSEVALLKWSDVHWDMDRFTVTSPKTQRYGRGTRVVPLFPPLRAYLEEAFDRARGIYGSFRC